MPSDKLPSEEILRLATDRRIENERLITANAELRRVSEALAEMTIRLETAHRDADDWQESYEKVAETLEKQNGRVAELETRLERQRETIVAFQQHTAESRRIELGRMRDAKVSAESSMEMSLRRVGELERSLALMKTRVEVAENVVRAGEQALNRARNQSAKAEARAARAERDVDDRTRLACEDVRRVGEDALAKAQTRITDLEQTERDLRCVYLEAVARTTNALVDQAKGTVANRELTLEIQELHGVISGAVELLAPYVQSPGEQESPL